MQLQSRPHALRFCINGFNSPTLLASFRRAGIAAISIKVRSYDVLSLQGKDGRGAQYTARSQRARILAASTTQLQCGRFLF